MSHRQGPCRDHATEDQTLIIELTIAATQSALFQSILQGEDGLGVVRCFDPDKQKQQLWTSALQKAEVYDWLNSLPASVQCHVCDQWYWPADAS